MVLSAIDGVNVLALQEVADPVPGPGEVLVRVTYCAVNRLDIWVAEDVGHAYQAKSPLIPGYDVTGDVVALGPGVADVAVGEVVYVHYDYGCGRCVYCLEGDEASCAQYGVMGVNVDGGYAQLLVAPARNIFRLDGLAPDVAAAAGSVYLTAYHMLFARAVLRPGETVLVTAAGSGVGGAAIALAQFAGARVIATASTADKRERALAGGAEAAIDYTRAGWGEEVRKAAGQAGVDVVIDHVGEATFAEALSTLAPKGRMVVCGASSGGAATLDLIDLFARQISLLGSSDGSRRELVEVFRLLRDGLIAPPRIDAVFPLDQAAEAQARLAGRAHYGRVLLQP